MKKGVYFILIVLVMLTSSCDTFRKLAGKPTSEEIEAKRVEMAAAAERDSLEQQALRDSLVAAETLGEDVSIKSAHEVGGLYNTTLDSRYYIIVGAFKINENAENMLKTVSSAGYAPTKIEFNNGFTAVGVTPTNSLSEARQSLRTVLAEAFCPWDVWILVNR